MRLLLEVLWFLPPGGMANLAPVLAAKLLPRWDAPLDGGRRLGRERILGDHKTIRGVVAGTVGAAAVFAAQRAVALRWPGVGAIDVMAAAPAWFGAALGLGALAGDAAKSFAKRRVGLAPGRPWPPFDQLDWMLGMLLVAAPLLAPEPRFIVAALTLALLLALVTKALGWAVRLNDRPI